MSDAPPIVRWWYFPFFLLLFGWPFLSFGAIFIFDSSTKSAFDSFAREILVYSVWLYPAVYFSGRWLTGRAVKGKKSHARMLAPLAIPGLVWLYLALFFVILTGR